MGRAAAKQVEGEAPRPIIIKRVKKGGHAHHGGSWKVAFADFATAMMAFFLLMWLMEATTEEQKGAISQYFNNPSDMPGREPGALAHADPGPGRREHQHDQARRRHGAAPRSRAARADHAADARHADRDSPGR